MVFAVHVRRDGAADGDKLRAGGRGKRPAPRQEDIDDLLERNAGFAAEQALLGVERQQPILTGLQNDALIAVQRGVAIGSPQPARNVALPLAVQRRHRAVPPPFRAG